MLHKRLGKLYNEYAGIIVFSIVIKSLEKTKTNNMLVWGCKFLLDIVVFT